MRFLLRKFGARGGNADPGRNAPHFSHSGRPFDFLKPARPHKLSEGSEDGPTACDCRCLHHSSGAAARSAIRTLSTIWPSTPVRPQAGSRLAIEKFDGFDRQRWIVIPVSFRIPSGMREPAVANELRENDRGPRGEGADVRCLQQAPTLVPASRGGTPATGLGQAFPFKMIPLWVFKEVVDWLRASAANTPIFISREERHGSRG